MKYDHIYLSLVVSWNSSHIVVYGGQYGNGISGHIDTGENLSSL